MGAGHQSRSSPVVSDRAAETSIDVVAINVVVGAREVATTLEVGARAVVLVGNVHGGAATHWGWQLAMAAPVPAQLHVPMVPQPSSVPGRGSHIQQLLQHHAQSGLSQPQPLAHPMKVLPTGYWAIRRR
jgi:hypothetical protein